MKRIILIIMIFLLLACETKQNIVKDVDVDSIANNDTNEIVDKDTNHSLDNFEAGDNWDSKGLEYQGHKSDMNVVTRANKEGILYIDEIYLLNGRYEVSFELLSDIDSEITIELLDDSDSVLYSSLVNDGINEIEYNLSNAVYSAKLQFRFVAKEEISQHLIRNLSIKHPENMIRIHANQVGYQNDNRKVAMFSGMQGNYFMLKRLDDDEIVYIAPLSELSESRYTDEYISQGDFTEFNVSGEYYLESSLGYKSYPFAIDNNVYNDISYDVLNMFTLQRCNYEIPEWFSEDMSHKLCHDIDTKVYTTAEMIDTRGGWHDAGDYGKYLETANKALNDLLIAYLINPDSFDDDMQHLESGNGIVDILDEIKYELDWLFKMQRSDGGVYSRVVTKVFADEVLPENDNGEIYALQVSSASSAGFGSIMALASIAFKDIDNEYASKCLEAAKLAYKYIKATPEFNPALPSEFSAGDYAIGDDNYYRFYLGIALWYATDDKTYLDYAFENIDINDLDYYSIYWNPLLVYPVFIYLDKANSSYKYYDEIYDSFIDYVKGLASATNRDSYRISLNGNYKWGSNQNVADRAMIMFMGHYLSNITELYDAACEHLDYLLGKNTLNYSFVVGHGEQYPKNIHHRITMVKNSEFKGALVGGPNSSLDDPIMKNLYQDNKPGPAKVYLDHEDSYSTNEIAIHFNSPMVFVFAYLNK